MNPRPYELEHAFLVALFPKGMAWVAKMQSDSITPLTINPFHGRALLAKAASYFDDEYEQIARLLAVLEPHLPVLPNMDNEQQEALGKIRYYLTNEYGYDRIGIVHFLAQLCEEGLMEGERMDEIIIKHFSWIVTLQNSDTHLSVEIDEFVRIISVPGAQYILSIAELIAKLIRRTNPLRLYKNYQRNKEREKRKVMLRKYQ